MVVRIHLHSPSVKMVRMTVTVGENWSAWFLVSSCGGCGIEIALEGVDDMLLNIAMDAPIGKVVEETRRFVRLPGVEVDRVRRRGSVCGLLGTGSLVGSLAAWRLLHNESKEVVLVFLSSSLWMSSM